MQEQSVVSIAIIALIVVRLIHILLNLITGQIFNLISDLHKLLREFSGVSYSGISMYL